MNKKRVKGGNKMKGLRKNMIMCLIFVGVLAIALPQQAVAAGTASDTDITNQATVDYSVGGSAQTPINSNTTTFKVDNKVDLTVATSDGAAVSVSPGSQNQVLTYTVTNDGNTVQDYSLSAAVATGTWGGATDNFDADNVEIYVEDGTTPGYQSAEDDETYIDELAPDASITVYIIADIPLAQGNDDGALYDLIAQTAVGGTVGTQGADITSDDSGSADNAATVQIVFADGAGTATGDGDEDGTHSSRDAYLVESAELTVTKTSTVIRDPFNLNTNPKRIPGAYVQYVITISNAAGAAAPATLTTITDALDGNTAIDPDLIAATGISENGAGNGFKVDSSATGRTSAGTAYYTTANDADGVEHNTGTVTATMATVLGAEAGYTVGELKPGESITLTFNVIIQ
jgi:hypothetical protein